MNINTQNNILYGPPMSRPSPRICLEDEPNDYLHALVTYYPNFLPCIHFTCVAHNVKYSDIKNCILKRFCRGEDEFTKTYYHHGLYVCGRKNHPNGEIIQLVRIYVDAEYVPASVPSTLASKARSHLEGHKDRVKMLQKIILDDDLFHRDGRDGFTPKAKPYIGTYQEFVKNNGIKQKKRKNKKKNKFLETHYVLNNGIHHAILHTNGTMYFNRHIKSNRKSHGFKEPNSMSKIEGMPPIPTNQQQQQAQSQQQESQSSLPSSPSGVCGLSKGHPLYVDASEGWVDQLQSEQQQEKQVLPPSSPSRVRDFRSEYPFHVDASEGWVDQVW